MTNRPFFSAIRQALSSRRDGIEEQRRAPGLLSRETVRDQLANDKTVSSWRRESLINRYVGAVVGEREMAGIVMLRELMRRPNRQSFLKTLVRLACDHPAPPPACLPEAWQPTGDGDPRRSGR